MNYPFFSGKLAAIFFYCSIILLQVTFLFYRIKVSKIKVWRGVLEATLMLLLTLSLLLLLLLVWVVSGILRTFYINLLNLV